MTSQKIIAYIEKKGQSYEVVSLNAADVGYVYSDNFEIFKSQGLHNGRVVSSKGAVLGYFGIDQMIPVLCTDSIGPDGDFAGGCREAENAPVHIEIPYFPNGQRAEIYRPDGQFMFQIDLLGFALCDENLICEAGENYENCPSDCQRPNVGGEAKPVIGEEKSSASAWLWPLLIFALISVGAGGWFYFYKNKADREFEKKKEAPGE